LTRRNRSPATFSAKIAISQAAIARRSRRLPAGPVFFLLQSHHERDTDGDQANEAKGNE
jgi:hypothetical protein